VKGEGCSNQCVGKKAGECFQSGYHCAEAVVFAVLEARGVDPSQAIAHATPFGGGVGRTFCEVCGALSGGLIAVGHMYGRTEKGGGWDVPASMSKALRDFFIEEYGSTGCGVLRDRFGEEQYLQCTRIVERVAEATNDILVVSSVEV